MMKKKKYSFGGTEAMLAGVIAGADGLGNFGAHTAGKTNNPFVIFFEIFVVGARFVTFAVNFGIDAVWYAFPIAEFVAVCVSIVLLIRAKKAFL